MMALEYWRGVMDWPFDRGWKCIVCGYASGMTWGLVHGICRCNRCHTQYAMRVDGQRTTTPRCRLKPEYLAAAIAGWKLFQKPIDTWTDAMWDEATAQAESDRQAVMERGHE